MLMALDLASAVTTCLSAGRLAAHSLDVLFKYASEAHGSVCPSRNATARFRPSTGLGTLSKSKGNEPS